MMQKLSASITSSTPARDKILFTAHDLFYQNGIRATGVDRLITESQVTKTTFYRHFPSKKVLIMEFLELRHQNWLSWFNSRIEAHGSSPLAIAGAIDEWLSDDSFRGCAFLNSVGELGEQMNEVLDVAQRHKRDVAEVISPIVGCPDKAIAIAVAIDGAILKAQIDQSAGHSVKALNTIISAMMN
jgi:AcrR family transcriptional regulator